MTMGKFQKVREILEEIISYNRAALYGGLSPLSNDSRIVSMQKAQEALGDLMQVVERLESEELVDNVDRAIRQDFEMNFDIELAYTMLSYSTTTLAQAAIKVMRGNDE